MTILSKAVKPCEFKKNGVSLTVLQVTSHTLMLNLNSMQIRSLPSQLGQC